MAQKTGGGLWHRRECRVPTWRGWLLLSLGGLMVLVMSVLGTFPFLAVTRPVSANVLVVEGWADDFLFDAAIVEFARGHYSQLLVSGGPIEKGNYLLAWGTYADVGAATLRKLGADTNTLWAVPAPRVQRDRTYNTALAVQNWLRQMNPPPYRINVISPDAHARRTWLLYEKALGPGAEIGIISVPDPLYEGRRWWATSQGFRTVIGEAIAYVYARLFFSPGSEIVRGSDPRSFSEQV